jgi:hypothetical protein
VQQANKLWAGPTTGADAAPTFRSLVTDDLPTGIPYANLALNNLIVVSDIASAAKSTTPTASTLVLRDGAGDFTVNTPTAAANPVTKAYVDGIYDIGGGSNGLQAVNGYAVNFKATRAMTLPANFSGSVAEAVTAATAITAFTVLKNGVSIGTMTFAAAGTVPTFSVVGTTSLAIGDTLRIQGGVTPDTTLSDIAITLKATLS